MSNTVDSARRARWEIAAVLLLLLFFAVLQALRVGNVPWENYGSWRQSDTYSIALNYTQYSMNPLRPQFNYDGTSGNYVQLELQIIPYLSAVLFKAFGAASPAVPRIMGLLLFLLSALYVWGIVRRFTGELASVCAVGLYLFMPLSMLYSRAIMPESTALFFYCGGVYYLLRWEREDVTHFMWLSAAFTAVAITQKTPVIFVGILIAAVFFWKYGPACLKTPRLYGYGAAALIFPAAYFAYASHVAVFNFVDGITVKHVFSSKILSIFTAEGIGFFRENLPKGFGWGVLLFACAGFVLCFCRKRRFLCAWAIAFFLECATIVALIRFDYYLVFTLPVAAVLCAVTIDVLSARSRSLALCLSAALLLVTGYQGCRAYWSHARPDMVVQAVGDLIQETAAPEEGIAVMHTDPSYLNAANRRGYRADIKNYADIPQDPEGELHYFAAHGVRWVAVIPGRSPDDPDYLSYLETHFEIAAQNESCVIYDLETDIWND